MSGHVFVLGLLILPVPSQESERSCICVRVIDFVCTKSRSERSCICVLGLLILPVPSQESERSCICVLGLLILPVPSQESERSCICVLGLLVIDFAGYVLYQARRVRVMYLC